MTMSNHVNRNSTRPHGTAIPPNNSQQKLVNSDYLAKPNNRRIPINSSGDLLPSSEESSIRDGITCQQWVTVAILCYVNLINYMDRFTIAGVLQDIQDEFHINNDHAGLLQTVFVVSYMIFAPAFGYLGDRYNRRYIMAAGVTLWSLTTVLGSFMKSFGWFMAFRATVGIGEASYSTIAPTIISDLFVGKRRSRMLAIFYFAIPVGSGLGYIVGSEAAKLGGSWHWGLRVTPVLGAIAVILILIAMVEPARGDSEGGHHLKTTSYKEDLKYLVKNRSFMLSTLGFTCVAFVTGALAFWGPKFIMLGIRSHTGECRNMATVSLVFGVITMFSGLLGVPSGMYLSTSLKRRNPRADPLICAFGLLTSTPLMFLAAVVAGYNEIGCYVLIFFASLCLNLNWSIVADMLLYVVIPTRRSTAEAFQILLSHTLGDAGSPYLIGLVSEYLYAAMIADPAMSSISPGDIRCDTSNSTEAAKDPILEFKSLQFSLFITTFVEVLGGLFFLMTAWYIISDKAKADKTICGFTDNANPAENEADEVSSSSSTPSF